MRHQQKYRTPMNRTARNRVTLYRTVLLSSIAALGLAGSIAARPASSITEPASAEASAPADKWLVGLNGKHRQLFDSPAPNGGVPLVHMMNFLDTWNSAYDVPDTQLNAVGTFYGSTTFHGLNDAMWTKYRLADVLKGMGVDAGQGASANPWRTEPQIMGMNLAPASIESLQKRGTRFILCNNALSVFAGMVAQAQGLNADAVYADMTANVLPDVELIPAMVVAIEQAHRAGLSYHRQ